MIKRTDPLLEEYKQLSKPSRGLLLTEDKGKNTKGNTSIWNLFGNRSTIAQDKVDSEAYKKIGLEILKRLKDFRTYFPFKSKPEEYDNIPSYLLDHVLAVNEHNSKVDEALYYSRLEKGFSELTPQKVFNKMLTRIESSPSLQRSFLGSLDEIVKPYDLLVSDLLGHENLLFPDSNLDSKNLDIFKNILSKSFSHQLQKKISFVSKKLQNFIHQYMNKEDVSTEKEALEDFISFVKEPDKNEFLHQARILQSSTGESFVHTPEFQKMMRYLEKEDSMTPSFISRHIDSFFPDKSSEIKGLWKEFLGLIRDGNDINTSKSDFSAVPELAKVLSNNNFQHYPAILYALYEFAFLYDKSFESKNSELQKYMNSLSQPYQIFNNPDNEQTKIEILNFFETNPDFNQENLQNLKSQFPQIESLFIPRNERDQQLLWEKLRSFRVDLSKIGSKVKQCSEEDKTLLRTFSRVLENDKEYIYRIKKLLDSFEVTSINQEMQRLTRDQKELLLNKELISKQDDDYKLIEKNDIDYLFKVKDCISLFDSSYLSSRIPKLDNNQKQSLEDFGLLSDSQLLKNPDYLFRLRDFLYAIPAPTSLERFDQSAWNVFISKGCSSDNLLKAVKILLPKSTASNLLEDFDSAIFANYTRFNASSIDSDSNKLFIILKSVLSDPFVDKDQPKLSLSQKDQSELQVLNRLMLNSSFVFEMMKFFRDNPTYSPENINKIESPKLSFLKSQFEIISPEDQNQLYSQLSILANQLVPGLNKTEKSLIEPLKEELDNFEFISKLFDKISKITNARFKPIEGRISLSNGLSHQFKQYSFIREQNRQDLSKRILGVCNTPVGVEYRSEIESKFNQIFKHFWENEILKPTPKQVVDYIKTLQGTHIGRRKFLAVAGAALLAGAGATLGVNKYNEVQYQEYLAKDFRITNAAINDPGRHLLYENIFLEDLNKFLNSLKSENEQFNKDAKETLFGEGNLDIPELIDLEPGSIIVAKNFTKRLLRYSFKEDSDGSVKIVSRSLRRFNEENLKNALKEAFKDTPDIDPTKAINPLTNKTYYESAEDFFKTSFDDFRITDRVFCPYYAFINPNGKLRIIVEPETANLCFSPFKSVDNLINILPENKDADRNGKFFEAYRKNLQTHIKMTQLESEKSISQELAPVYRELLARYGNRLDFNNELQMREYDELLKRVDLKLEERFNLFRTSLKNNRDTTKQIRILNMEWWYSLQNYSNMSNLSASSLVGNLSRSLANNRVQLEKLVVQHDNRPVSTTFAAIEQKLKHSKLVDFTIQTLTDGILPGNNDTVA